MALSRWNYIISDYVYNIISILSQKPENLITQGNFMDLPEFKEVPSETRGHVHFHDFAKERDHYGLRGLHGVVPFPNRDNKDHVENIDHHQDEPFP